MEQGRTRQRPRSQPLSYEYYRSLFLFGIRGRYVSPGVCVGCCLGEDTKLAVAPLTQSLFSRPRGRRPPRGRRRHAMAVGALVPPDAARVATRIAARTILALQQCTQMPQNGTERPFSPICVHSCVPTSVHNGATVYTNAPERRRGAIFADLCTLLTVSTSDRATGRRHGSHAVDGPMAPMKPGRLEPEVHAARAVTHPPTRAHEAPDISLESCEAIKQSTIESNRSRSSFCTISTGRGFDAYELPRTVHSSPRFIVSSSESVVGEVERFFLSCKRLIKSLGPLAHIEGKTAVCDETLHEHRERNCGCKS